MKDIPTQIRFDDVNDEYKAFVEKFKPKKTTDDCYTPDNVYEAVKGWVCSEYGINPDNIVRPFWPGGDYERFPYTDGSVVVDNPPFSILAQICGYYLAREIPFFLFAPYLTNFNSKSKVSHIIAPESVVYENGAEIPTAFVTSLDEYLVRSVPELMRLIEEANQTNIKAAKKQLPKYIYPPEVLTATDVGYMCKYGVEFKVRREDAFFVREIDSQKALRKSIFGGGISSVRTCGGRTCGGRTCGGRTCGGRTVGAF